MPSEPVDLTTAQLEEDIAHGEKAIAEGDLHDWEAIKRDRLAWLFEPDRKEPGVDDLERRDAASS